MKRQGQSLEVFMEETRNPTSSDFLSMNSGPGSDC